MAKRKADEAFAKAPSRDFYTKSHLSDTSKDSLARPSPSLRQRATALLQTRQQLPIWPHADEVRTALRDTDVLVLVGETGSGKSTQIPQFLYQEEWCSASTAKSNTKVGGRIAILQPRRVAAISLATRVAQEAGTPLGSSSPASTVGYSVRFDSNVSPNTKIKFLTDGMLLQELLRDPWLKDYSCVIVDEVHERGVNVDLVLGFLRRILEAGKEGGERDGRHGVPLKVIVMSATADMEGIRTFFSDESTLKTTDMKKEDCWSGFSDDGAGEEETTSTTKSAIIRTSSCFIKGRQYPVTITYSPQPVTNLLDTIMNRIIQIHQHTPLPGHILVFLSGQEMIENLESLCHTYASALNQPQSHSINQQRQKSPETKLPALQILPLFASLPNHLQARIFHPTPSFTRRIILATNIAETSITVPGIRHVIDTGKHKSRLFRPRLNLDTLLSTAISQSMARQRAGRAGREAPGHCYRLYTKKDYHKLEKDTKPEILSTDLSFLVLTLKAHGVVNVLDFPLLTKPPQKALESALEQLLNLNALKDEDGTISEIGRKMAALPVRPDLARILLESTKHNKDVFEGAIDIVSALSLEEGIFLPIHSNRGSRKEPIHSGAKKSAEHTLLDDTTTSSKTNADDSDGDSQPNPIETARRKLLSRHSDHLTLMIAIQTYASPTTHDRRLWCEQHGISHRAMSRIMDVRKQLRQMMSHPRFQLASSSSTPILPTSDGLSTLQQRENILRCLVSGLWTNVAILTSLAPNQNSLPQNPNQRAPYVTLMTNQPIHIHPSSILFTMRSTTGGGKANDEKSGRRGGKSRGTNMPHAIIFTDLIYTSKPYARNASAIEMAWITELDGR